MSPPPTETTSLLPEQRHVPPDPGYPRIEGKGRRYVLALICISIIAADFGTALSFAPQIEIYESVICNRFFGHGPGDCKSGPVQDELVLLNGWKGTFDQLPGIVLAIPYGLAADRIGRKPVLLLALVGLMLEETFLRLFTWWSLAALVPLRSIWAASIFQLIGGGPGVATSMAYSIITDTFPSSQRASVYFLMAAAVLIGEIVASPLSAFMMSWTPWLPSLGGLLCQVVGTVAAAFLPETKPLESSPQLPATSNGSNGNGIGEHSPDSDSTWKLYGSKTTWRLRWRKLREHGLLGVNVACIAGALLMASIGTSSTGLIVQYASLRFSWSIARASLLMSVKGTINLVCLLLILPYLSQFLSRRVSPAIKDLRIVQGSVLCWTVGFALMSFAGHAAVFIAGISVLALGTGYFSALRSLANSLGTPSQIGVINTSIGISMSAGSLIAGPLLAAAFQRGSDLGGIWSGLPYLVAACLLLGTSGLTWAIRISGTAAASEEDGDDAESVDPHTS